MDTPIAESNLAHIGSDDDKAAREAAAKCEANWEGAGEKVGIQVSGRPETAQRRF